MQKLILHNLGCHLGGKLLFENISCTIESGQILLINGENGSGKTTLLSLLSGQLEQDEGSISYFQNQYPLSKDERLAHTACLGHRHGFQDDLKVIEALRFWQKIYELSDDILKKSIDYYDLCDFSHHSIHQLSQGTKRRLGLARLHLLQDVVGLVLLDEPTSHLDKINKAKLFEMLKGFLKSGGMVVIASHEALPIMHDHLLELGTPHV